MTSQPTILERIRMMLENAGITYRHVRHEPTFTSEQSAAARNEDIRIGGKALLVKVGDTFKLFVLSAGLKLDSASVRREFGVRKARFATAEELKAWTGLVPGSVPPFGKPILPFDLYVDESVCRNDRIAFNAGSLTDSIILNVSDYLSVANPTIMRFSTE